MKVNIQAINFNVDRKLVDFANERLLKIEKYYDKIVSVDVFFKLENTNEKENKITEIKVLVPGDEMIVKKTCKTFEEGVDAGADALERLVVKHKEKIKAH
ncbi:ribosome-associated translation inhibitor RaiA [Myroides odoratimimus]|uniref:ribosome hibernation-promoting factor, HPF/YfiA family n=1 Tax=Myroides odoratimimus TaxID=76832 RepID=UPI00103DE7D5|nr:ribosome-associated translation inhibitor RaiA [Myroides odoratimimus]MCA4791776.1 ribosome-associated translation inhibitor RaiA [Myroides odoratimimus]MCA4805679.1 ribosome-associated translation inhibitor RaiA [Myroides odoratimimus]MCA4819037.1 ribosome-associated translation inhibitor RaiA [Myroides odoratimimus]MDM1059144.1 ribosome-associated translation inhibitor RaiA [Myroides odoratimimus]MDM1091768.1 ribosome-associated translation inhibitor RaiA [Myroides odoratimimus]